MSEEVKTSDDGQKEKLRVYVERFRPCPKCGKPTMDDHPDPIHRQNRKDVPIDNTRIVDMPDGSMWFCCLHCGAGLRLDPTRRIFLETITKEEADARHAARKAEEEARAETERKRLEAEAIAQAERLAKQAASQVVPPGKNPFPEKVEITPEEQDKLAAMFIQKDIAQ
jgi:hypothetical protein